MAEASRASRGGGAVGVMRSRPYYERPQGCGCTLSRAAQVAWQQHDGSRVLKKKQRLLLRPPSCCRQCLLGRASAALQRVSLTHATQPSAVMACISAARRVLRMHDAQQPPTAAARPGLLLQLSLVLVLHAGAAAASRALARCLPALPPPTCTSAW
jgi:hypothetical protein